MASRVRVAIIGLGFGAEFIPIYQNHPDADMYAVCQRNPETLEKIGQAFNVKQRYARYEDVLKDPNVDAVHINTPIPDHAPQALAAFESEFRFSGSDDHGGRCRHDFKIGSLN